MLNALFTAVNSSAYELWRMAVQAQRRRCIFQLHPWHAPKTRTDQQLEGLEVLDSEGHLVSICLTERLHCHGARTQIPTDLALAG